MMKTLNKTLLIAILMVVLVSSAIAQDSLNVTKLSQIYDELRFVHESIIQDDYLYVATGETGLFILNISDVDNPSVIASLNTPGDAVDLAISGTTLLLADRTQGLRIIDISDPANPTEVGFFSNDDYVYKVKAVGNRAYLANGGSGLTVLDISTPASPVVIGSAVPISAIDIAVYGDYVYLANTAAGISIVDASDIASCHAVGSYDNEFDFHSIEATENYLHIANTDGGYRVLDVSDAQNPELISTYQPANFVVNDVTVNGNYVYLLCPYDGFLTLDISNPVSPQLVSTLAMSQYASSTFAVGQLGCINQYIGAVNFIDLEEPGNPENDGYFSSAELEILTLSNNYALILDSSDAIRVVNIEDASQPIETARIEIDNPIFYVESFGDITLVDFDMNDSYLYFSSNLPEFGSQCELTGVHGITDAEVQRDLLFISTYNSELFAFDISDPDNPVNILDVDRAHYVDNLCIEGNNLYLTEHVYRSMYYSECYLYCLDISDPSSPVEEGLFTTSGKASALQVENSLVNLVISNTGLHLIDYSDSTNPIPLSRFDILGNNIDADRVGDFVFVANRQEASEPDGIQIIDISDPEAPELYGFYMTDGHPYSIEARDNLIYLSDQFHFEIFDYLQGSRIDTPNELIPDQFEISNLYPNPFNPTIRIEISLPHSTELSVKIFSITGQEVALIHGGVLQSGIHNFEFSGVNLGSGTYFVQAEATGVVKTKKITLVR